MHGTYFNRHRRPGATMRHSRRHIAWQAFRDGSVGHNSTYLMPPLLPRFTEIEPGRFTVSTVVELRGPGGLQGKQNRPLKTGWRTSTRASKRNKRVQCQAAAQADYRKGLFATGLVWIEVPPVAIFVWEHSDRDGRTALGSQRNVSCKCRQWTTLRHAHVIGREHLEVFWINLTRVDKFNF